MTLLRRAALSVGTLVLVGVGAVQAADQTVVDRRGNCQITVPGTWKVDPTFKGNASSTDKQESVAMSSTDRGQSLGDAKKMMSAAFKPVSVIEDSANRYWYEYKPPNATGASRAWYVGIPVNGNVCGAQITMKDGNEAVAKSIAASLTPRK